MASCLCVKVMNEEFEVFIIIIVVKRNLGGEMSLFPDAMGRSAMRLSRLRKCSSTTGARMRK